MKRSLLMLTFLYIFMMLLSAIPAKPADDFTGYINRISAETSADSKSFNAELSAEFGIPVGRLNEMQAKFGMKNGDLYFALELSRQSKKPLDSVSLLTNAS